MGFFVSMICRFPGDLFSQLVILGLTNAAMTFVCLAISSLSRSAENASLLSVYLVGLQLPLSCVARFAAIYRPRDAAIYRRLLGMVRLLADDA